MFKPILNQLTKISAQSNEDAERFRALGASSERVVVGGNLKFDVSPTEFDQQLSGEFIQQWGTARTIIMAASTHDDEEKQLLVAWPQLKKWIPDALLLIAPRHPERFNAVYQLCQQQGYPTGLRSMLETITQQTEVIVLDSLGELSKFYTLCGYAFVGGSLVPVGGHNVLEPIAANVPVFCGPYMNHSKSICDALIKVNGLVQVGSADALMATIMEMHHNPSLKAEQIENAMGVLIKNRGALRFCLDCIESVIPLSRHLD